VRCDGQGCAVRQRQIAHGGAGGEVDRLAGDNDEVVRRRHATGAPVARGGPVASAGAAVGSAVDRAGGVHVEHAVAVGVRAIPGRVPGDAAVVFEVQRANAPQGAVENAAAAAPHRFGRVPGNGAVVERYRPVDVVDGAAVASPVVGAVGAGNGVAGEGAVAD